MRTSGLNAPKFRHGQPSRSILRLRDGNLEGSTMKLKSLFLASALGMFALAPTCGLAQTVGQDMKSAGHDTADASKKVGHKTERGTKTAARDTEHGTAVAAHKTEDGAKTVGRDTKHGTEVAAHKTAAGTRKAARKTDDAVTGKPE